VIIDGAVSRDRRQPRPERRRVPQRRQPFERGQKHVVHDVVDVPVRNAREHHAVHHPDVALVQLAEGRPVAGPGSGDQRGVRLRCPGDGGSHFLSLSDPGPPVNRRKGLHG
jgi:hypothetical protein